MHLNPLDDEVIGPSISYSMQMAQQMGEDLRKDSAALSELIEETSDLLTAVDAAISQTELVGDQQWETMRRCWCFLGPGIFKQIEMLKNNDSPVKMSAYQRPSLYTKVAFLQIVLTIRRQTLEMNGIEI